MSDLQSRLQAAVGETYRIEKELGGGGMSRVFLAEEVELGRRVVIKVLPPEMAAGVNQDRFRREIQLAAKLQHPHVVPLLTAGSHDDLLYYVMPFIEGESLRAKLAREGELPVSEAVHILKEVVDALTYAHGNAVVHRDIKPDNVLLSGKHAVVTDFGVAKAVSASTGKSSLTSLGVALGTPAYMAPEQAVADPHVDHRADIYAVGAMAYEMLTGRPPFSGPNPQAVLSAHVTDAPEPATRYRETVPPALNELVMRCLQKKAADRWQKAEELLPHLDAILTPSGGITPTGTQPVQALEYEAAARQAHPVRVAALFSLAAAVVLAAVYFLMIQFGLPDWVFVGAVILLVIGFPIMVTTGHRERQRAIAQTTGLHVTTPVGLERHFTWRKALLGGGVAFAGLGVVTTGYMSMRLMGIGPVGSLVASGALEERGLVIVAEFEDHSTDASLGPSVTEAFRIDLAQSPVVRLMDASAIAQALRRMNRDPATLLDLALAREIAEREGVGATLTGDIGMLGQSYVLSARLLASADGAELVALREAADDDGEIIDAVDRLSAKLRERIGESLKTIRRNEPLERVTTASLAALKTYSRGVRANEEGDTERAIALLEEALGLDSTFAMAYRKLAVVLSNSGAPRTRIVGAAAKAFEHRHRLPDVERYLAEAYYYTHAEFDRAKAIAAYRSVIEVDPGVWTALNNLAVRLNNLRRWEEAEQLALQAQTLTNAPQPYANAAFAQVAQGKLAEAQATVQRFAELSPGHPSAAFGLAMLASGQRDYVAADTHLRSIQTTSAAWRSSVTAALWATAQLRGQLAQAKRQIRANMAVSEELDDPGAYIEGAAALGWLDLLYHDSLADAVRKVAAAVERYPLAGMAPPDRPYVRLARFYAEAGRPELAKELLTEYEAEVDEALRRAEFERHGAAAALAAAEGRLDDAIAGYRAWYDQSGCPNCALFQLGRGYELAGLTDSALAVYERAVSTQGLYQVFTEYDHLAQTHKRLGELYEERGDRSKAVEYYNEFVELWKDADEELQPVVQDVRQRIARLVGEQ